MDILRTKWKNFFGRLLESFVNFSWKLRHPHASHGSQDREFYWLIRYQMYYHKESVVPEAEPQDDFKVLPEDKSWHVLQQKAGEHVVKNLPTALEKVV